MRRPLCFLCLLFTVLLALVLRICPAKDEMPIYKDGITQTIIGEIVSMEYKNDKVNISLDNVTLDDGSTARGCLCYVNDLDVLQKYRIGQIIKVVGKAYSFQEARNEGMFDARSYYRVRGLTFYITNVKMLEASTKYSYYKDLLFRFKLGCSNQMENGLELAEASVLQTMLLGMKGQLEPEIKALYQQNGIAHILAISGLHISMLGIGLYKLMRVTRMPKYIRFPIAFCVMLSYGIMCGQSASLIRSLVMFFLYLLADFWLRTFDILTALSVSAVILLLQEPLYLYDVSFQLSFGAVLGIALISPILEQLNVALFSKRTQKIIRKSQILGSLSVSLATFPILLYHFFTFPLYGTILNLFILACVAVLLASSILGVALSFLFPSVAVIFFYPARIILNYYEALCHFFQALPFSTIILGRPKLLVIWIYYISIIGIIIFYEHRGKVKRRYIYKILLAVFCINAIFLFWHPRFATRVTMLDIGQGDCFVVECQNGTTFLIDGGSSSVTDVAKYRILPYLKARGIHKLDYVFISHPDEDHVNGIISLLTVDTAIPIDTVVMTKYANNSEAYATIREAADFANAKVLYLQAEDKFIFNNDSLQCLYPSGQIKKNLDDLNDESMVLLFKGYETKMLFVGDLTSNMENQIKCSKIDILKVGHHGSKNSSSLSFLKMLSPKTGLISAGISNSYGHPHKETLERLEQSGITSYQTKDSGEVYIVMKRKKYNIYTTFP